MTRDYSRREFVAGCGCAGAGALLAGNALADSGGRRRLDAPPTRWDRTYQESGDATANAVVGAFDDDGFVVAGAKAGEDADRVAWLYKVDATGNLVWERTYSQQSTTVATALVTTEDGYALAGNTSGSSGGQNGFAIRVDPDGAVQWRQTFWFNSDTDETVNAMVQRPDNGFVCAGETSRFENGWVKRLGSDGAVNAGYTYNGGDGSRFGGIANHPDGGQFLAGAGMDASEDLKGWVMHINDEGEQQWASSQFYRRENENPTNPYNDFNAFYDVAAVRQGFVVVGATGVDADGAERNGWVMELNNTGVRQWATTLSSEGFTELYGIASDGISHYVVGETAVDGAGTEARGYVSLVDLVGETLWSETYARNTASQFHATAIGEGGGILCVGDTASSASASASAWGVKIGGPEVTTPTPTPSPTPTRSPTPSPSPSPTVSPSPRPPDTPSATSTPTPTPTATPRPTTAPPAVTTTTTDTDEGSGPPLAMLGVGFVIVALGAGGFLYNRYLRGDDDGEGDGTIAGPGPATGGSAPLTDEDAGEADGADETDASDDLTPASDVEADEEVTGAQTVVEKPETDDTTGGEPDDADTTPTGDTDQSGESGASDGESTGTTDDTGSEATETGETGDTETAEDPGAAGTVEDENWGDDGDEES